jgi:hypothetical protein
MRQRHRAALGWAVFLSVCWVLLNLPHEGSKGFYQLAGFPWTFVRWKSGGLTDFDLTAQPEWFDFHALAADFVFGMAIIIVVASVIARLRPDDDR